ncbi:putative bifunctional diguanylate cyclase/phosphodiesterase [Kineococcus rhizosphaerae]|uniref:PAS domain S-box-containing protein/diguanylate cyclase (GGDEF)-like protein n=1 Tax=Kineococcus rhizosphaerae TaxID=559628 RepID=A0A2T0R304_9ACTN|nr:EAL domain-containing protein [Kineococcus rhizosphaerae]PRY14176.1 PAS domain S-box-containing protein/diguanylate cyclase (GGDEF)-like protein [Kineococcus rhizosphaerae]
MGTTVTGPGTPDADLARQLTALRDQLDRQSATAAALREQEERFRLAFDVSLVGMAIESLDPYEPGRILRVNEEFCHLLGRTADDLVGRGTPDFAVPDDRAGITDVLGAFARGELERWEGERRYLRPDGEEVRAHVRKGLVHTQRGADYLVSHFEDVTERHRAEQELLHLALHDQLTGLPNRHLLDDHLGAALARARRDGTHVALLFLDLDDFKDVNDVLGHQAGDAVLVTVAHRVRDAIREADTAARYGGDEFVVVCETLHDAAEAEVVAQRLIDAVSTPLPLAGRTIVPRTSVGITVCGPGEPRTAEVLLSEADAALYEAKLSGKNQRARFTHALRTAANRRLDVEEDLRAALGDDELRVHYQPIVDLRDGAVIAAEALVRWQHPVRGLLAPVEFIDVAEQSDLIADLGEWVLREAGACLARWQREGQEVRTPALVAVVPPPHRLAVSVNASVRQVSSGRLRRSVEAVLADNGLLPGELHIEITETQFMSAAPAIQREMAALSDLGVGLSLDDFGTGYSSLAYLKRLPFNCVKLDRSYVSGIGVNPGDEALVDAVLALAGSLGLHTVAEGVETPAQERYLRERGCGYAQGYLYSPPVLGTRPPERAS